MESTIEALNPRRVRYLVADGLAVAAHGDVRFTADVDLIVDLEQENLEHAVEALRHLGSRPRPPVALQELSDAACSGGTHLRRI